MQIEISDEVLRAFWSSPANDAQDISPWLDGKGSKTEREWYGTKDEFVAALKAALAVYVANIESRSVQTPLILTPLK